MGRIDNQAQYLGGSFPGWHPGQYPFENVYKWYNFGGSKTFNGVTWWGNILPNNQDNFKVQDLFGSTGGFTVLNNSKRYNTCAFIGADVRYTDFTENSFKYKESSRTSGVRNVMGFSCQNTCAGSFSDKGGDAQAFLEKVGLFYADRMSGNRYTYIADQKVAGSHSLNSSYSDQGTKWYTYRLSDADVEKVHTNKYLLMGMGFQFVHTGKAASHTSTCKLTDMRIIVGDGPGMVGPSVSSRIMLIADPDSNLGDFKYNRPVSYTM